MKMEQVRKLPFGIYKLHWASGGDSIAAVGGTDNGGRWMAPINWITPTADQNQWRMVLFATPIDTSKALS